MSVIFNLIFETETGELIPFESAADLFAFVEKRMEREAEDDEE